MLARFGEVLLEPWLDRIADYGCSGRVGPQRVELDPVYRQELDGHGVFRFAAFGTLDDGDADVMGMRSAASLVGDELAARGYRGPFNIDGFSYRAGEPVLRPISEINARHSLSPLARRAALGELAPDAPFTFHLAAPDAALEGLVLATGRGGTRAIIRARQTAQIS
jgi:hypothetical protein